MIKTSSKIGEYKWFRKLVAEMNVKCYTCCYTLACIYTWWFRLYIMLRFIKHVAFLHMFRFIFYRIDI